LTLNITELLNEITSRGASDLHLSVGLPPVMRLHGELQPLDYPPLKTADTSRLAGELLNEAQLEHLNHHGEVDLAYAPAGLGRFRVNVYRQRGSTSIALRVLNTSIPNLSDLGMPPVLSQLARWRKGLIIVTGPTGSGKSTTLAAMINQINQERSCHILTLEDPIEYMHQHGKSLVNQREVGQDSEDFAKGLRAALRQDPDVILVGEMRDLETIATAITAAETGHLVLATLHTMDAPQTIDRIIDVFPPHQQQQIRVQLANNLAGVVAQQLLRKKDGKGRVAAVEVLVSVPAVRNLIREGKIHQIYSSMQTGGRMGMQTMDASLKQLFQKGLIDAETALEHAVDAENMEKTLGNASRGAPDPGPSGKPPHRSR